MLRPALATRQRCGGAAVCRRAAVLSRLPPLATQRRQLSGAETGSAAVPEPLAGRLPDGADAASSFDWLQQRFAAFHVPSRADLETALGRIEDEADLDAAFATMRTYRANAIPLTQETAAATVGACLRSGRADIGAHVLNFHRLLRVWPSADEYAVVIESLLGDSAEGPRVAEALSLLEGAARAQVVVPQASVDAIVRAAAESAGKREAAKRLASAAGDTDEEASDEDAADDAETDAEGEQYGIPLKKLEKVLVAAADNGSAPSASACEVLAVAAEEAGQTERAGRLRTLGKV